MRALLVIAVLALAVAPAGADTLKPEAQKHLDAGLALFDKGDYGKAIDEFKAAYEIDPAPKVLFALAQARRLSGDCDTAMELYNQYLATLPSEAQTEAAKAAMKLCDGKTHPKQVTEPPVGFWHAVHEVVPQLPTSLLLTHLPPHRWYPVLHASAQFPPTHCAVPFTSVGQAVHAIPHAVASLSSAQPAPHL